MKIRTENICPPIPSRNFDWAAYDDDTYDGDSRNIGHGPTELAAIEDLLEKLGIDYLEPVLLQFIAETDRLEKFPARD